MTKQKRKLNEALTQFKGFVSAHEIHSKVPEFGLATVYRFLKDLEQNGGIHSYTCNNKKIYSINKRNHAHFICEKCKTVRHVDINNVDFIEEVVTEKVCHFQLELVGTCEKCG